MKGLSTAAVVTIALVAAVVAIAIAGARVLAVRARARAAVETQQAKGGLTLGIQLGIGESTANKLADFLGLFIGGG